MRSKENVFVAGKEKLMPNEIPSISVYGESLPEAWETAVMATYEFGCSIPTEYDQDIDPDSKDASMMMTIAKPLKEPRIHLALPAGIEELAVYVHEVVDGVHDHWVREKGWSYSYHDRLKNWPGIDSWEKTGIRGEFELPYIDQINVLTEKLIEAPHSRRAQAITWYPPVDAGHHEPPCLQRLWCRVIKSDDEHFLEMNDHFRSNDAFKATFMNLYALTELQKRIADELSEKTGREIGVGRLVHLADSFHIYGSYIRKGEIDDFLSILEDRSFEDRVWRSDDIFVEKEFEGVKKRFFDNDQDVKIGHESISSQSGEER